MNAIDSCDTKAYSILSATGIIASFYIGLSALFFDKYKNVELFNLWSIFFIVAIFLIVLTSIFCLMALKIRYVMYGPDPDILWSLRKKDEKDIYFEIIDIYKKEIEEENSIINASKGYWLSLAVVTITFSIFSIVLSSLLLILIAHDMNINFSILILIMFSVLFIAICLLFKLFERKYIENFT